MSYHDWKKLFIGFLQISQMLYKSVRKNFAKFTGKHLCRYGISSQMFFRINVLKNVLEPLFNKVAGLNTWISFKKKLVKLVKFLRTPFCAEHLQCRCLRLGSNKSLKFQVLKMHLEKSKEILESNYVCASPLLIRPIYSKRLGFKFWDECNFA